MRLVAIDRAVGHLLARDIPAADPRQMPLLRAGAEITDRYVHGLKDVGIHAVWVHDEMTVGIEPVHLVPPQVREESARMVSTALARANRDFDRRTVLSRQLRVDLADIVDKIVAAVAEHGETALVLSDLQSADAYTHQHSIDVCALGILLGRAMFLRDGWRDFKGRRRVDGLERRVHQLGIGLLLHDIGKIAVPGEVLNKPGALSPEEMKVMQTHPDIGAQMLTSGIYSPLVRAIVREHHERWDGKGYPRGLAGHNISQLARIAAVADVYDAVTSHRPYSPAKPAHVGVDIILQGAGTAFDPEVVDMFRRLVLPYPVGTELQMADGSVGVVASAEPGAPHKPLVRFPSGERVVDLDREKLAVATAA
jgi:HD-GYP domain-containing protein (c-di-GMP phosphodiesterase class II)